MQTFLPRLKKFTTQRAVILHAEWLVQSSLHWPIFLTAASRRSRVRVSVPVWGAMLSHPLLIVGLVGRYPTNYLIRRTPILYRLSFNYQKMPLNNIMRYYSQFPRAIPQYKAGCVRVTHPCATNISTEINMPVRLACIRPSASVHPEPGSNSPYFFYCTYFLILLFSRFC